jgi:2-C-methyl-D-erythritol 4-phosphate cytidylyltransferase/2-C-methyl-D-erythritol 2,4-cyclodiphosphate synthase
MVRTDERCRLDPWGVGALRVRAATAGRGRDKIDTMRVAVIVAAGGRGERLGAAVPKQFLPLGGRSLLARSVAAFRQVPAVREIVVVLPADLVADGAALFEPAGHDADLRIVAGGARRQDSVARGFAAVSPQADIVLVHDAARPLVGRDVIERAIGGAARWGAAVAAVRAQDTVKEAAADEETPPIARTLARERIWLAQTPQAFRRQVLAEAIALGERGVEATDEAALAELAGHEVRLVPGDVRNLKITTEVDREIAEALAAAGAGRQEGAGVSQEAGRPQGAPAAPVSDSFPVRIGLGYDSHRFAEGRPLVLGGVRIPAERGLAGHSDGDAICHAVTDAILGAAGLGDIGALFPDTDPAWKGADSLELLRRAAAQVAAAGYRVASLDIVAIAETPRLAPWREAMRDNLASALGVDRAAVGLKGKTNEKLGALGRAEGLAVHAVALLVAARAAS